MGVPEHIIKESHRREFLKAVLRLFALSALGFIGVKSTGLNPGKNNNFNCLKIQTCRECVQFKSCLLPPALTEKKKL